LASGSTGDPASSLSKSNTASKTKKKEIEVSKETEGEDSGGEDGAATPSSVIPDAKPVAFKTIAVKKRAAKNVQKPVQVTAAKTSAHASATETNAETSLDAPTNLPDGPLGKTTDTEATHPCSSKKRGTNSAVDQSDDGGAEVDAPTGPAAKKPRIKKEPELDEEGKPIVKKRAPPKPKTDAEGNPIPPKPRAPPKPKLDAEGNTITTKKRVPAKKEQKSADTISGTYTEEVSANTIDILTASAEATSAVVPTMTPKADPRTTLKANGQAQDGLFCGEAAADGSESEMVEVGLKQESHDKHMNNISFQMSPNVRVVI